MSVLDSLKRVNARPAAEESVALRVAVLVAVMAGGVAVLQQGVGGPAVQLVVLVGLPAGFAFSHVSRYRSGFWLKAVLAMGVVVVFGAFLKAVTGIRAGNLAEVQVPLAELFLWVQLLHALDVPARRDLLFSLVSSLVLIGVAGVLSISLSFGLPLLVWGIAALAALVLAHRSELAELPRLSPGAAPSPLRALRPLAAVVVAVAALGGAAFYVVPPAGGARAATFPTALPELTDTGLGGGLSNPSLGGDDPANGGDGSASPGSGGASFGYFGFSDELDTGARGRPDDTLVMRVRASAPDFWRGQSFDRWDGRRWVASDEEPTPVRGAAPLNLPSGPAGGEDGEQFVQTYYVEEPGPNIIFAAPTPSQLYFTDNTVFTLTDGTIRTGVELPRGSIYTVISHRPPATPDRLRAAPAGAGSLPKEEAERYLQLPEVPERVRDLASSVAGALPSTYEKVRALERWMAENTAYSLDIPRLAPGADAVEQYLFEDRRGFCEQIGTSLVVMLRSLGVPARLGVGYAAGERNPFTGLYEVRAADAHAWAEVWFPGFGWQIFDPTASVPLAGLSDLSSAGSGLASFLAERLPAVPDRMPEAMAVVVAAVLGVAGARAALARRARQRRLRARSWPDVWLGRLEERGASAGRPRRESESVREYVRILSPLLGDDPRWPEALRAVEWAAFSGRPLAPERQAVADAVLAEAPARR